MNKEKLSNSFNIIVLVLSLVTTIMIFVAWKYYLEFSKTPEDRYMECYNYCAKKRGELPPMTEDICLKECVPIYMEEKLNGKD